MGDLDVDQSGSVVDYSRRRFLTTSASVVGGIGIVAASIPFIKSMSPSARTQSAGAPVEAYVGKMEPGQRLTVEWRGRPVWIIRRTETMVNDLSRTVDRLRDPDSNRSQQPDYAKNSHRAIKPRYLVLIGICTHLGCAPTYRPDVAPEDLGTDWFGGFFCACHGSRFDMAGRVYQGVPAPTNLVVPPYSYIDDAHILIGKHQGITA